MGGGEGGSGRRTDETLPSSPGSPVPLPMRWIAVLALLDPLACEAQPWPTPRRPAVPVLFDDFAYSPATLEAPVPWATRLGAPPPAQCSGEAPCERLWWRSNWYDEGPRGERVIARNGTVRLQNLPGDTLDYGPRDARPPLLTSGFVASRGTWVARVRLAEIRHPGARAGAPGRASFVTQAFWVASPHYASHTGRFDRAHWSEFNIEWNNYFYPPRAPGVGPPTGLVIDQFAALGATFDGETQGTEALGTATGGLFPRDPSAARARPLTCQRVDAQGRARSLSDERACQDALASRPGQPRDVVLLFRYDGATLTWELASPAADGSYAAMAHTERFGRRAQPMLTHFSQMIPSPSFCRRTGNPVSRCTAPRDTLGFDVDWFLYSPDPTITLREAVAYADWLRQAGYARVNTTGRTLRPPAVPAPASAARLHAPDPQESHWTFVPPPLHRVAGDDPRGLSWRMRWFVREQPTAGARWSDWQARPETGFSALIPARAYRTEVTVEADDWHGGGGTPSVRVCRGVGSGTAAYACAGRTD